MEIEKLIKEIEEDNKEYNLVKRTGFQKGWYTASNYWLNKIKEIKEDNIRVLKEIRALEKENKNLRNRINCIKHQLKDKK